MGTVLEREHGGAVHKVTVLEEGFRYAGETHGSLSTIAKAITGVIWNGYVFFGRGLKEARYVIDFYRTPGGGVASSPLRVRTWHCR